jgi:hypothetical protein
VLDFATNAARSVLGQLSGAEHRVEQITPGDEKLHEATAALHRNAESLEHHAEALESLTESLPALTEAITQLSSQLAAVLALAAPVEAAERDVRGFGRLFRLRRRRATAPLAAVAGAAPLSLPTPPPSEPAAESGSAPR